MNELLSHISQFYHIALALIGASTLWLAALAFRDYYKCKRYQIESENQQRKSTT